jgi:hypothetical protein
MVLPLIHIVKAITAAVKGTEYQNLVFEDPDPEVSERNGRASGRCPHN